MKTGNLLAAIIVISMGCSRSDIAPRRNTLVVNYPVQEVWNATARLIFEKNWTMEVVDEGSWLLVSELMEMPSYGSSRWWDCGMRPTTTMDSESNPTNPTRTLILSSHQIRMGQITEDSTAVILTMAPHRSGAQLIPCRSRGGYERLFYEEVEDALENAPEPEAGES